MEKISKNIEIIRFRQSFFVSVLFVLVMWLVLLFTTTLNIQIADWGVYPRNIIGLRGILFSPFIHGDYKHLLSNSFPFIILFGALIFFYPKNYWKIFILLYLFSGILLWIIGRSSFHIGASGIIYALTSYHFFAGVLSRRKEFIAISLIVVFLYGGTIWGVLPSENIKISWEAHLSGFAVGTFFALIFYPRNEKIKINAKNVKLLVDYLYFYDFKTSDTTLNKYKSVSKKTQSYRYFSFSNHSFSEVNSSLEKEKSLKSIVFLQTPDNEHQSKSESKNFKIKNYEKTYTSNNTVLSDDYNVWTK